MRQRQPRAAFAFHPKIWFSPTALASFLLLSPLAPLLAPPLPSLAATPTPPPPLLLVAAAATSTSVTPPSVLLLPILKIDQTLERLGPLLQEEGGGGGGGGWTQAKEVLSNPPFTKVEFKRVRNRWVGGWVGAFIHQSAGVHGFCLSSQSDATSLNYQQPNSSTTTHPPTHPTPTKAFNQYADTIYRAETTDLMGGQTVTPQPLQSIQVGGWVGGLTEGSEGCGRETDGHIPTHPPYIPIHISSTCTATRF